MQLTRYLFLLSILFSSASQLSAQYNFEAVFPGLSGSALEQAVNQAYRPLNVLNYSIARDSMFRNVYGVNNTLSCVYTGHTLPMPPGQDPTEAVFLNGIAGGINTEHSWPRSYGAENGNPKSDMHHLFPTRVDVNSDRGTLPFLDIPDFQTDDWYYLDNQQGNIPSSNIDLYSERRSGDAFEPREDHKGNVARAMMYFKTIYPQESLQAPSDFWTTMLPTLCDWHGQDPVDSLEWHRSWIIASYQENKPNPFVLDCTLAERLFCAGFMGTCDPTVPTKEIAKPDPLVIFPNPARDYIQVNLDQFPFGEVIDLRIFDSLGRMVSHNSIQSNSAIHFIELDAGLADGWYFLQLNSSEKQAVGQFILDSGN